MQTYRHHHPTVCSVGLLCVQCIYNVTAVQKFLGIMKSIFKTLLFTKQINSLYKSVASQVLLYSTTKMYNPLQAPPIIF